jgi:hypothetical protein
MTWLKIPTIPPCQERRLCCCRIKTARPCPGQWVVFDKHGHRSTQNLAPGCAKVVNS